MDIKKIAFFDIETVGCEATYDDLLKNDPRKAALWASWQDKYKETNGDATMNELWLNKAGLHAEYGKVVCVSIGAYDKDMNLKIQSFYGDDERDILEKTAVVLNNSDRSGYTLSGHTIERFDIPYLWKRMLALGITPPSIISVWDKKPWDLKFFDIAKVWSGGSWKESFTSLDTMSAVFNVDSPKDAMKGKDVHYNYWVNGLIEDIKTYCEKDVRATMEIANNVLTILNPKLVTA